MSTIIVIHRATVTKDMAYGRDTFIADVTLTQDEQGNLHVESISPSDAKEEKRLSDAYWNS